MDWNKAIWALVGIGLLLVVAGVWSVWWDASATHYQVLDCAALDLDLDGVADLLACGPGGTFDLVPFLRGP